MRRAKRRAPSLENARRAAEAARAVDEFQAELASLDRALDEAIRQSEPSRAGSGIVDRSLGWLGLPDLAAHLDRFDRVRGSERVDEFGLDPEFERMIEPFFAFLYRHWWRVEAHGIEKVPAEGPALLVADHAAGPFPLGGVLLKMALRLHHPAARELRPLVDDFVFRAPFLASLIGRVGGVRACAENAARLLRRGELVGVFPERARRTKRSRGRTSLQRFARGGFIASALRTRAPILPVAIVRTEEISPLLGAGLLPGRLLGLSRVPLRPTSSWLGFLGLSALPGKWMIRFGEPIRLARRYSSRDASDPALVDRLMGELRETMRSMLGERRQERGPAFS